MEIRKSKMEDLERILELYQLARKFMKEHGNPTQWGENYPPKELIRKDIEEGNSYLCFNGQELEAAFYFREGNEKTYEKIDKGNWQNEKPYGVVHRITACQNKKGAASYCLSWCLEQCRNIRIDTHRDNIPMQKMLEKNGFQRCGIIYLENGEERIAYQREK